MIQSNALNRYYLKSVNTDLQKQYQKNWYVIKETLRKMRFNMQKHYARKV